MSKGNGGKALDVGPRLRLDQVLLYAGVALLVAYGVARTHGELGRRAGLREFESRRAALSSAAVAMPSAVDDSLWSEKRIRAYRASLDRRFSPPLAVLRIERIGLEVPVLEGTDELTLNRAVGWIPRTSRPGEGGNVAIAGHRDGFFRGLKDIAPGDSITLETLAGTESYRIEEIRIVGPKDVSVLEPTAAPTLTLVTCFPFYFVGDAPQRCIVRAVRQGAGVEVTTVSH